MLAQTLAATTDEGKKLMLQTQLSAGQACLAHLSEASLSAQGLEPLRDALSALLDKRVSLQTSTGEKESFPLPSRVLLSRFFPLALFYFTAGIGRTRPQHLHSPHAKV